MDGIPAFRSDKQTRIGPGNFMAIPDPTPAGCPLPDTDATVYGRGLWRPDPETKRAIARGDRALARHRARRSQGPRETFADAIERELVEIKRETRDDVRAVTLEVRTTL